MVKCKDCIFLMKDFTGFAYCNGNLNVDKPEAWYFNVYSCFQGDTKVSMKTLDPLKDQKCSNFRNINQSKQQKDKIKVNLLAR